MVLDVTHWNKQLSKTLTKCNRVEIFYVGICVYYIQNDREEAKKAAKKTIYEDWERC